MIETYDWDHELLRNHSQVIVSVQPLYATSGFAPCWTMNAGLRHLRPRSFFHYVLNKPLLYHLGLKVLRCNTCCRISSFWAIVNTTAFISVFFKFEINICSFLLHTVNRQIFWEESLLSGEISPFEKMVVWVKYLRRLKVSIMFFSI